MIHSDVVITITVTGAVLLAALTIWLRSRKK